jgi:hypothetical protein
MHRNDMPAMASSDAGSLSFCSILFPLPASCITGTTPSPNKRGLQCLSVLITDGMDAAMACRMTPPVPTTLVLAHQCDAPAMLAQAAWQANAKRLDGASTQRFEVQSIGSSSFLVVQDNHGVVRHPAKLELARNLRSDKQDV